MAEQEAILKRIMPHSEEAEQSVIGSMMMSAEAIEAASEMITSDDFYQKQYGVIFDSMLEIYNEGKEVDFITLQDRLREKNVPPEISDLTYVRDLLNIVPTSANIREYCKIVKDKSRLRTLISLSAKAQNRCYEERDTTDQIMEDSEAELFRFFQTGSGSDSESIGDIVVRVLENIEKAAHTDGTVTGLATGFTDLDYKTSGFQKSDLILVAARPSMGKTAFVLNIAEYMAFRKKKSVAIFSLEMSRDQLVNRLIAMEGRLNSQNLRNGRLNSDEWGKLIETANVIGDSHLIIDDTPGITVQQLRSKCHKYQLEYGLDIVMIDYLQLMSGSGKKTAESRQQEISEISRSLKALARELQVPVVALSQLSRAVESRTDHRPILSDLRESGAIEQDADVVMFLYRDDYYNKDSKEKGICEVNIAKQRNGPIGTINLAWLPDYTKFMNAEPDRGQQ